MTDLILRQHKLKIKECFNKAANTYDEYAQIQQQVGKKLIKIGDIQHTVCEHGIDLGCGTGRITEELLKILKYKDFSAIDLADYLLLAAKARLSPYNVQVCEADFDSLPMTLSSLDFVFSNMTLQWSLSLEATLTRIAGRIKPGGILLFSLPLEDTFQELNSFSKNTFYKQEDVKHTLKKSGYTLLKSESCTFVETFQNQLHALKSVKAVGANYTFERPNTSLEHRAKIKQEIKRDRDHSYLFNLTYKIGFFKARKAENVS